MPDNTSRRQQDTEQYDCKKKSDLGTAIVAAFADHRRDERRTCHTGPTTIHRQLAPGLAPPCSLFPFTTHTATNTSPKALSHAVEGSGTTGAVMLVATL